MLLNPHFGVEMAVGVSGISEVLTAPMDTETGHNTNHGGSRFRSLAGHLHGSTA